MNKILILVAILATLAAATATGFIFLETPIDFPINI